MESRIQAFSETLSELMEDAQMGVNKLAETANCDKAAIRRWFYNMYLPDPQTLIKITNVFNVSADYLFGLTDEKEFEKVLSNDTFYQRYSRLRDNAGYSDYFVSNKLNIRDSAISKWKNIKSFPTTISLLKLADFFHCSLDYLLGRSAS